MAKHLILRNRSCSALCCSASGPGTTTAQDSPFRFPLHKPGPTPVSTCNPGDVVEISADCSLRRRRTRLLAIPRASGSALIRRLATAHRPGGSADRTPACPRGGSRSVGSGTELQHHRNRSHLFLGNEHGQCGSLCQGALAVKVHMIPAARARPVRQPSSGTEAQQKTRRGKAQVSAFHRGAGFHVGTVRHRQVGIGPPRMRLSGATPRRCRPLRQLR